VAELERHHAGEGVVVRSEGAVREDFERGALGILERQYLANPRRNVVTPLALDPGLRQPRGDCVKIAAGCDLKRQARCFAAVAAFERDRFQPGFGGEEWRGPCRAPASLSPQCG